MISLHWIGLGSKSNIIIIEQYTALEESSIYFTHVIISLAILLIAAKLFAELFHRLKLPVVLAHIIASSIK